MEWKHNGWGLRWALKQITLCDPKQVSQVNFRLFPNCCTGKSFLAKNQTLISFLSWYILYTHWYLIFHDILWIYIISDNVLINNSFCDPCQDMNLCVLELNALSSLFCILQCNFCSLLDFTTSAWFAILYSSLCSDVGA